MNRGCLACFVSFLAGFQPEEVRALCVDCQKASKMYSERDQDEALRLAVVVTDFLQQKRQMQITATFSSSQILDSHQPDATSFVLQHRGRGASQGAGGVRREGKGLQELLLERIFRVSSVGAEDFQNTIVVLPTR